jgi:hypothetical protein
MIQASGQNRIFDGSSGKLRRVFPLAKRNVGYDRFGEWNSGIFNAAGE